MKENIKKNYKYKFNIGDIITPKYGVLKINNQKRVKYKGGTCKGYNVTCLICTYNFDIQENHLKEGCGCSVYSHHKVLKGYNDMWTTNPDLAKMLLNHDDGYIYAEHSNKKTDWKCLCCGEPIYNKTINDINRNGLSCPKCSDGLSYPNKYMYNVLKQLNIDFEPEKKFDWCIFKKYNSDEDTYGIYDFVIEIKKLIIEMDSGLGHGKKTFKNKETKEESAYKDLMKDELAHEHGYTIIRIPCDYNDLSLRNEVCKKGIIQTLYNIFDLKNIDWNKAHIDSLNSYVMNICDLYNQGLSTNEITQATKLSIYTVLDYLKQGTENGFCNYVSPIKFNKQFLISKGYNNINTKQDLHNVKLDFICNYYNSHTNLSARKIGEKLGLCTATVARFLNIGSELGYCDYKPNKKTAQTN